MNQSSAPGSPICKERTPAVSHTKKNRRQPFGGAARRNGIDMEEEKRTITPDGGGDTRCICLDHVLISGGTTFQGKGWYMEQCATLKTQPHGVLIVYKEALLGGK